MPGILPMKVIKVGTGAQTRIAQACDRCRSKKIRCDGFRPTCTQCSTVGFECKTSDKLSRRAFPRGYTESLEERVRALEGEIRELKDLLDERDEKIELLSKMHDKTFQRSGSARRPSVNSTIEGQNSAESLQQEREDLFKVQQSPLVLNGENTDSYFMGTSSVRNFIEAFKYKLQESGRPCSDLSADLFSLESVQSSSSPTDDADLWRSPPRLLSDQMVNIFFQEWAPLFPVLHKSSFLGIYDQYVSDYVSVTDKRSLAQLNLVFGIAILSNDARMSHSTEACEKQWMAAMETFQMETSLVNLQCLLLAQMYCAQKGDAVKLLHYKGLAVGIAQRLGLHLSQKRFSFGALTVETRKKVFWTMYTLDCFTAAFLGLPKLLKEDDIHCEYPVDYDDEYVTEKGFLPTLPGEFTKLSSALALFRGSRILAKVLTTNYPSALSHELSLRSIAALDDELQQWSDDLPSHLKLEFVQDKPSTNIVSSRCPLLSLTYNYIRTLIHRPAVCAKLGDKATSSKVALASANKRIIQIIQLLDERKLSFSHCINKNEVLLLSGIGFLYQTLDLDKDGKMMQDSHRLICTVIEKLERRQAPGASEFKQLGCSMLSIGRMSPVLSKASTDSVGRQSKSPKAQTTTTTEASPMNSHEHLASLAARYNLTAGAKKNDTSTKEHYTSQSARFSSEHDGTREKSLRPLAPSIPTSLNTPSPDATRTHGSQASKSPRSPVLSKSPSVATSTPNLDYYSFTGDPSFVSPPPKPSCPPEPNSWERLLTTLDVPACDNDIDKIYDWSKIDPLGIHLSANPPSSSTNTACDSIWSPESWMMSGSDSLSVPSHPAQSVLSFTDESLAGSDNDYVNIHKTSSTQEESLYRGLIIPQYTPDRVRPTAGGADIQSVQVESES